MSEKPRLEFTDVVGEALREAEDKVTRYWKVTGADNGLVRFALGIFSGCVLRRLRGEPDPDPSQEPSRTPLAASEDPQLFDWLLTAAGHNQPRPAGGDFVRTLAEAALRADWENYAMLRPTLLAMQVKYPDYSKEQE